MSAKILYHTFVDTDFEPLLIMSQKLWKDIDREELKKLLLQRLGSEKQKILIAKTSNDEYLGFSIFTLRTDYVEGAKQSPTGYLEGIFVEPAFRKMGIAKEFVLLGEAWCKENGCSQIGSDTWLSATASRNFHKKMGFWEEDELVHFLKNIP
ncbi:GNAT family N-acetyltransferase [Echinicola sediminis]